MSLTLEMEDPCWPCKSQNPVFVCVVDSLEEVIIWRHDWEIIAIDDGVVTTDPSLYTVSTQTNNTQRRARMQLSRKIPEYAQNNNSTFVCEHHGYRSRSLSLHLPGNDTYNLHVHTRRVHKNSYNMYLFTNVFYQMAAVAKAV